jgi:hypothetical protein
LSKPKVVHLLVGDDQVIPGDDVCQGDVVTDQVSVCAQVLLQDAESGLQGCDCTRLFLQQPQQVQFPQSISPPPPSGQSLLVNFWSWYLPRFVVYCLMAAKLSGCGFAMQCLVHQRAPHLRCCVFESWAMQRPSAFCTQETEPYK